MLSVAQKNLGGIPVLSLRIENLSAAPGSPFGGGHLYFDTALAAMRFYDGGAWRNPLSRADHTGTQIASTISNLAATVQGYSLSAFATPTAALAMGGFKITGLAAPTQGGDAAEYAWVVGQIQSAAAGIVSRPPVRAVAAANITLSGTQTIDGVSVAAGDRVLATAQTAASANGVYVVAAGAWARAAQEDQAFELAAGATWLVTEGTSFAGTQWRQATTGAITLGSTALSIVQFSAGGIYTASTGVQLVSSNFSLKLPASSGLIADTTGVYVDPAIVARKYSVNIGDGSTTAIVVTHNLNTRDIHIAVRDVTTFAMVEVDWAATTVNTATISFAAAPASNAYRATVIG